MMTPLERTIVFVIGNLPDSFAQRKVILLDLLALTPVAHKFRTFLEEMLHFLEGHEQHQLTFPTLTVTGEVGAPNGETGK